MKDTLWKSAIEHYQQPDLSRLVGRAPGAHLVRAVVDRTVGLEVFLCLTVPPGEAADRVKAVSNLALSVACGGVSTPSGPVLYALFVLPGSASNGTPPISWEALMDPHDDDMCGNWLDLAQQSHWHVAYVTTDVQRLHVLQYENIYKMTATLPQLIFKSRDQESTDFGQACVEFLLTWTREDLMSGATATASEDPIGDATGGLREAVTTADAEVIRRLGARLYHRGGEGLMHRLHNAYIERYGADGQPDVIDKAWTGLGGWQAG